MSVNSISVDSELRVDLKLRESTLHREKTFMNSTSGRCKNEEESCADTGRIHTTSSIVNIGQNVGQTDAGFPCLSHLFSLPSVEQIVASAVSILPSNSFVRFSDGSKFLSITRSVLLKGELGSGLGLAPSGMASSLSCDFSSA